MAANTRGEQVRIYAPTFLRVLDHANDCLKKKEEKLKRALGMGKKLTVFWFQFTYITSKPRTTTTTTTN